MVRQRIVCL